MTLATLAKLEHMSLQHFLKDVILPLRWSEIVRNAPLVFSAARKRFEAQIVWLPNFLDQGRGWVFFDPTSGDGCVLNTVPFTEQTSRVIVFNENGVAIDPALYKINYLDGAIVLPGGATTTVQGTPTTVDFTQNYVAVTEGWPGADPPPPPIVSIEMTDFMKKPLQLGGGRISDRRFALHIFATSSSERHDLNEFLHDALFNRHIPILDFREGEPLDFEGFFNPNFTGKILKLNTNDDALFYFKDIKVSNVGSRPDWGDLNRWRSKITFTTNTFRDGLDFLALG